jgi:hypothetical protein
MSWKWQVFLETIKCFNRRKVQRFNVQGSEVQRFRGSFLSEMQIILKAVLEKRFTSWGLGAFIRS